MRLVGQWGGGTVGDSLREVSGVIRDGSENLSR